MGVVAVQAERQRRKTFSRSAPAVCAAIVYTAVVALAVWHHEPWADEAQAWLLARDAGLADLWTRLLHYEGTPGLWQTLLHFAIRLGAPYSALNMLSGGLGAAACCLVLWRAPFPLAFRMALPFTFYLCYQYAVVARSYALLPVLLFGAAILYGRGVRRPGWLTTVLALMAAVSVHGMVLSSSIWLALHLEIARQWRVLSAGERKQVWIAGSCYAAVLVLLALAAWPASDNMFVTRANWSLEHLFDVTGRSVTDAFAGSWVPSLAAIALSLPFLWKGRALSIFVFSFVMLSLVNGIVYSQVWHHGLIFLGWLFAVWIAGLRAKPGWAMLASLAIVIGFQCYWTVRSAAYDWSFPYSGSKAVAAYLRETNIPGGRLYAIGYACVGIEPYFSSNIFADINGGRGPSYWDWSKNNHVNENSEKLATLRPDYVIVGYKGTYEKELWTGEVRQSGYQLVRHFEGNTFWRTAVFEPESFDLYRRPMR